MPHKNPIRDMPKYLSMFQTYLGGRMYLMFGLSLVAGLAEGVGIFMLLPLLQTLGEGVAAGVNSDAANVPQPTAELDSINRWPMGMLAGTDLQDVTVVVLFVIAVAFVVKGVMTFGALGLNAYLRGQLLRGIKERLFDAYANMDYGYYARRDTGHFINLINEQTTRALQSFNSLSQCGTHAIHALIYLGLAFLLAWRFGLMALMVGMPLTVLFRALSRYVRTLSRQMASENGRLAKLLIQTLQAFKYLSATGQMHTLGHSISQSIERMTGYQVRVGVAQAFTKSIREPMAVVFIMGIVLVQLVFLQQPLAPILVAIPLFYRGLNAVLGMQGSWQSTLEYIGSMELVNQEFTTLRIHREPDGGFDLGALDKGIRLNDVSFSYDKEVGDVISGMSFEIPARTSVAFVGESGAGKSTLVGLLTLTLKPRDGQILIDGVLADDIKLSSWRTQIGYVSQDTVVFNDTIANNISLWGGDGNDQADFEQRIRHAARQAHLAHFIETLPDGYNTVVGDRGLRLSGGQQQRLFIARELFRKPSLLILDEATSALDAESESAIQASIDELRGQITVVIIAHRLSTIRHVDWVCVLERGRLVEQGDYQKLKHADESKFAKWVATQTL